jgi:glycerophosphoryl diester phosphodiesterase
MSRFATDAVLFVAHRGGRGGLWPTENTLLAFERARASGATAIELDVREASDGVAVCHDATLAHLAADKDERLVSSLSLGELAGVQLAKGGSVPSLADVLDWADAHDVSVNIELKRDGPSRMSLVTNVLAAVGARRGDYLFSSFDPGIVAILAVRAPHVRRALLTAKNQKSAAALHTLSRKVWLDGVNLERTQTEPQLIGALRARGLRVGVWTVNDVVEARALIASGANWIISDEAMALKAAATTTNA